MAVSNRYCSFDDVSLIIGASPEDFRYLNKQMNYDQFKDMVEMFIDYATESINRFCNVNDFHLHEVRDELHSITMMRGFHGVSGLSSPLLYGIYDTTEDYSELSREVFLREYPVNYISDVYVSYQVTNSGQEWKHLEEILPGRSGDYSVISRFDHKHIKICRNIPRFGNNNCKVSYVAGYPSDHPIWTQLKMAAIMIVKNVLDYKKSSQEIYTVRGSSIQSYASMFDNDIGGMFLSKDVVLILDKWRRPYATPDAYY